MVSHKVAIDGLYACKSKQAPRHYESDLFSYAKDEHFEGRCIVCQHKLNLSDYTPLPSNFDLLKQSE